MPNLGNYLVFSTSWVAIVYLIANQLGRSESIWLALLGTVIVGGPILVIRLYSLTVRRIHDLNAYHQRGILFSLFSGRNKIGNRVEIWNLVYRRRAESRFTPKHFLTTLATAADPERVTPPSPPVR